MCRLLPIDQSEITLFDPVADKARRERLWRTSRDSVNCDAPVVKEIAVDLTRDERVGSKRIQAGKLVQVPSEWKNYRKPKIAYVRKTAVHNPPPPAPDVILSPLDRTKELLRGISEEYNVHIDNVLGQSRKKEFVAARMHAYHQLYYHHGFPLLKIGRLFNKDHSTVLSGIRKYRRRLNGEI